MRVFVRKPLPQMVEKKEEKEPEGLKVPWPRVAPIAAGLILYGASLISRIEPLKDLAFFVLLAGLLIPWLQQG